MSIDVEPLRQRVVRLLISPTVRRINFSIMTRRIQGSGFAQIAVRLDPMLRGRNRLDVTVATQAANVGASYRTNVNHFSFPRANFGTTPAEQMTIVHEATHALLDFTRSTNRAIDDEAAAYIAGAMFMRYSMQDPTLGQTQGVFAAAGAIANAMIPNPAAPLGGIRGWDDEPPAPLLARLRQAVVGSPTYTFLNAHRDVRYVNAGVPR